MPRIRKPVEGDTAVLDDPQPVGVLDEPVLDEPVLDEPAAVAAEPPPIRTAATPPPDPSPGVSTPPADPLPVAAAVVAREVEEIAAAESLLIAHLDGRQLTPDEDCFLNRRCPGQFDRSKELQRIARYRRLQKQAGSGADRAAAERLAEQAAATLATEAPAIREQIAALQSGLQALETAAADAQAAHDRRVQAVDALRDPLLLPEPHHSRYEASRRRWETDYGTKARSLRHQAEGLRQRAGLDPAEDANAIASYCQSTKGLDHIVKTQIQLVDPSVKSSTIRDRRFVRVDAGLWQAHTAELIERADQADRQADELEVAGQALRAELDRMLMSLIPE